MYLLYTLLRKNNTVFYEETLIILNFLGKGGNCFGGV